MADAHSPSLNWGSARIRKAITRYGPFAGAGVIFLLIRTQVNHSELTNFLMIMAAFTLGVGSLIAMMLPKLEHSKAHVRKTYNSFKRIALGVFVLSAVATVALPFAGMVVEPKDRATESTGGARVPPPGAYCILAEVKPFAGNSSHRYTMVLECFSEAEVLQWRSQSGRPDASEESSPLASAWVSDAFSLGAGGGEKADRP